MVRTTAGVLAALLAGCATTLDPNYHIQIEAYRATITAQQQVEVAKANAEAARYEAMASLAEHGDQGTRNMVLVALALSGRNGGDGGKYVNVTLPAAPEKQEDKAYKWAALFATPVVALTTGYFGYRNSVHQTDANRDITVASYSALGSVAGSGFNAAQGIAQSGFGATRGIGIAGFNAIGNLRPNQITLSGTGVIGDGTYTGPYSGANSGNSGRINSPNDDHSACPQVPAFDGSAGAC